LAQEQALVAPIWPTGDTAHHHCANPVPGFSYTTNLTRFISLANRKADVGKIPRCVWFMPSQWRTQRHLEAWANYKLIGLICQFCSKNAIKKHIPKATSILQARASAQAAGMLNQPMCLAFP
jgi:hypothetical protein